MLRFGKDPPKHDYRTLLFRDYAAGLPAPPVAVDNLLRAEKALPQYTVPMLFPMDGNDVEGCCTIAALAHAETLFNAFLGKKLIPTAAAVHKLYRKLTGGVDSGLNELDVLNAWRKSALNEQILAYVKINPRNHIHVQQTINEFGSAYIGFQVQRNAIQKFEAHQPWTPDRLTQDGHAVLVTSYDQDGVTVLTWGDEQEGTWPWWDECVDECWAVLPNEAQKAGFAPGFNFTQLKADLSAVAS